MPKKPKAPKKPKSKDDENYSEGTTHLVCFTIYDMDRDMAKLASEFQYLAYGEEVCPTTGRKHYQGFCYNAKDQRWPWWFKRLTPANFRFCKGTLQDNETYCAKEGSYHHFGIKPMGNGHKRSLATFCERLQQGEDFEELVCEDPVTACQYHNGLKAVARCLTNKRMKDARPDRVKPEVIYIYGPSGTGKSDYAHIRYPDLYDVSDADLYKWKDEYRGEETVLYDNLSLTPTNFNKTALLREIDKYAIRCPVKGGFVNWRPKRIFITSIFSPAQLATAFDHETEFLRRITTVLTMEDYFDPTLVGT